MRADVAKNTRSGIEVVITGLTRNQFGSNPTRVRIPPAAPCKDDYFDTMGIGVIVPTFCLKPPKIAEFLILLRKEPSLTGEISGTVMALFCF